MKFADLYLYSLEKEDDTGNRERQREEDSENKERQRKEASVNVDRQITTKPEEINVTEKMKRSLITKLQKLDCLANLTNWKDLASNLGESNTSLHSMMVCARDGWPSISIM